MISSFYLCICVFVPVPSREKCWTSKPSMWPLVSDLSLHSWSIINHGTSSNEDDNAPYVNGTDTADVVISFNRTKVGRPIPVKLIFTLRLKCLTLIFFFFQGGTFGTLFVFDRDLTTIFPKDQMHNRYVETLLNNDAWIKDTFDIKDTFNERRVAHRGIRESVHDYRKWSRGHRYRFFFWTN